MGVLVYAMFDDDKTAAKAVDALVEADFTREHISVLLREPASEAAVKELPVDVKSKVGRGVKVGAALGAIGGALVATGGGVLAAGPIVALVQGTVGGAAVGILVGFVGGLGGMHVEFDKDHGETLDEVLLVGAMTDSEERVERARRALHAAGATQVRIDERTRAIAELEDTDPDPRLEGPYGVG
jgi:uncharacterized membrane protein